MHEHNDVMSTHRQNEHCVTQTCLINAALERFSHLAPEHLVGFDHHLLAWTRHPQPLLKGKQVRGHIIEVWRSESTAVNSLV